MGLTACGAANEEAAPGDRSAAVTTSALEATTIEDTATSEDTAAPENTAIPEPSTSTTTASTQQASSTQAESEEDAAMTAEESEPICTRLTDFSADEENQRWLVVNDDVMGGRSLGGMSFDNNTMIFSGDVNTNGGGFASLRLPLAASSLTEFTKVAIRARPDARTYVITFDDNLPARNRRVSHRAPIPFDTPGQWQTITVPFEDLFPAIFGQPIDDLPFRPDLAVRMGLMISDGLDGPFQLEVDWIDLCP